MSSACFWTMGDVVQKKLGLHVGFRVLVSFMVLIGVEWIEGHKSDGMQLL
ncbi:hypothetical protein K435DRAFT_876702 [Dendrothele bispora CBS 962.96]|uniref:Uncharacterized protein n=1 Tax=Dendrothele bispora (strain CBS 962.96) TaxID=1314807 RepID=A0A4S8KRW9_DENBC|nr:hypothetical protein K435DRAFT_876702 [Dendrothele bispora CBS 962.96]